MLKAKVGDSSAWQTHCQALTSRTSSMERRLALYLKKDQIDFSRELGHVHLELDLEVLTRARPTPVDNTRVVRPPILTK